MLPASFAVDLPTGKPMAQLLMGALLMGVLPMGMQMGMLTSSPCSDVLELPFGFLGVGSEYC